MDEDTAGNDEPTLFETLFEEKDRSKDVFYFRRIDLGDDSPSSASTLRFVYSLNDEIEIVASVGVDFPHLLENHEWRSTIVSIGMCILCWYWMGYACPVITIDPEVGYFTAEAHAFWDHFYSELLLEFCFVHKITSLPILRTSSPPSGNHSDLVVVGNYRVRRTDDDVTSSSSTQVLLPLGGGKDSLVAWHLCKAKGQHAHVLYVCDTWHEYENNWRLKRIAQIINEGSIVQLVRHNFHSDAFECSARSFYRPCGHPWAALVYFDALLISSLIGVPLVLMGHEKSADYGNGMLWLGREVNHQYDKSSDFLHRAQLYSKLVLNKSVRIESALAEFYEIEIARIFAQEASLKPLHSLFLSCNEPIDVTRWCAKCAKCCFVFLIMSAWMSPPDVWAIFGDDLFAKPQLLEIFLSLVGINASAGRHTQIGAEKPFECVGTFEEARCAVELSLRRRYDHMPAINRRDNDVLTSLAEYLGLITDRVTADEKGLTPSEESKDSCCAQTTDFDSKDNLILKHWLSLHEGKHEGSVRRP